MSKLQVNTQKVVDKLLAGLSARNRDIISRRFGLKNGKKETLEAIGQSYSITRERVRQIEEATLTQLRQGAKDSLPQVQPYFDLASSIIEEHGGILKEEDLFEHFSNNKNSSPVNSSFVLLLSLDKKFNRTADSDEFYSFWSLGDQYAQKAGQTITALTKLFNKESQPIAYAQLANFYKQETKDTLNPKILFSYISLSKNVSKNIFEEFGLSSSPDINPKGVRDKAYLVLKRTNKPCHFTDITRLINDASFSDRKANIQTVHNELIKDKRFVLVGRGMYGLSNWGYKAGTVKDVLVDVLKDSAKPLTRQEIVAKVLSARFVKENTIHLNLQDSKVFKKLDNGTYSLREA